MLESGTRLGPYEILSAVGSGGMGEVYRARDTRLQRTVAIKILAPQLAGDAHFRERFEREARVISQLSHPNICTLYDVGEFAAGEPPSVPGSYLVMEFVEGEPLSERLARGALPRDQALAFAAQIAAALDAAHRLGIVHRDLKPGNVMVTKTGIKLLDFGLAEQRAQPLPPGWSESVTRTTPIAPPGAVLGTLQYLAPEQLEGRESDARSDIFACGAVVYEMVIGRKAFEGDSQASVVAAIMRTPPPSMASIDHTVPAALDHAVATALARDPDDRWQSAADLKRQLTWIAASRDSSIGADADLRPQSRGWILATTVLLLATIGFAVAALLPRGGTEAPAYRTSIVLPEGLRFPGAGAVGGIGRFAISPNGQRMAFVAVDANGNQVLWIRAMDALAAVPIPGTDGASSPFWSPDSRLLAFIAQGTLKTVDLVGGMPVVVATPALNATGAWNHDNVILFTPTAGSPLNRVSASGGAPRPVTPLDRNAGDLLHRNPFFLPDGRHFLYVAVAARSGTTTGPRAVYVGSLTESEAPRLLIDSGSSAKYAQGQLIFLRDNTLLAQPFDADRFVLSGEPRPIAEQIELNGPSSAVFSLSDTGTLAYQAASTEGSQLAWLDREGRQIGTLGDPAQYGDLELSPDGRRVAVTVSEGGMSTRDIWVFDVARGVRTRFTFDRGDDVAPVWATDDSEIIFASNRRGHMDLYRKSMSGVGQESLVFADSTEKTPTSMLPDGHSVLFARFGAGSAGLAVVSLTGVPAPASFLDAPVAPGRLSPDGRWVVYTSNESGRSEIYVVPFPTASRKMQLSSAGGSLPRWRHDGREIIYAGRDNRLVSVAVNSRGPDLDFGPPLPLFEARPVGPRAFFDVSSDGQRFLLNVLTGESLSSSITVVQNWSAALAP